MATPFEDSTRPLAGDVSSRDVAPSTLAMVTLTLVLAYVAVRFAFHGDISRFVRAGSATSDAALTPSVLHVRDRIGYDGQFFYRLALDPLTKAVSDFGIRLDNPPYRHQRIAYPLIAWALSFGGRPLAVAWALVLINVAALGGVAVVGGSLARSVGRPALAGLFFSANPALWIALAFDTPEAVAGLAVLLALVLLRRERYAGAATVLVAAVFVRETTLLLPIGLALAWFLRPRQPGERRAEPADPPAYVWLLPAAAYVVWQVVLAGWWGTVGLTSGLDKNTTLPLLGLTRLIRDLFSPSGETDALDVIMVLLLLGVVALGMNAFRRGAGRRYERFAFGASVLLLAVSAAPVWFSYVSFVRANVQMITFATLLVLSDRRSDMRLLLVLPTATALVAAFTVGL